MSETKTKWTPSGAQREVLEGLKGLAAGYPSVAEFCRKHLPFSDSKYSKVMNALDPDPVVRSYFDVIAEPDGLMEQLEAALREASLAGTSEEVQILQLSTVRAVIQSVRECNSITSPERITKYLGPTGAGKSIICECLRANLGATVLQSRTAWKKGSYTMLKDICQALGVRIGKTNDPSVIEDMLVRFIGKRSVILAIDEGEYFGAAALDLLKLLLNKTRVRIVIAAIAEAHDKWNSYFPMQASQISRRTHAVIELTSISTRDAALFFPANQFAEPAEALRLIAEDASAFGAYSLIRRVADDLKTCERVSNSEVVKSALSARKQMLRGGMLPQVHFKGGV